ncbi:MAG: exosortase O, partial [Cyanobacteria bacterium P01_E01_bin.34]
PKPGKLQIIDVFTEWKVVQNAETREAHQQWTTRSLWAIALVILSLWGGANASALYWLVSTLESASLLNLGLALGVIGVLALSLLRERLFPEFKRQTGLKQHLVSSQVLCSPQLHWAPLAVMLGALCSTIAVKSWADIPQLEVVLFVLGTYGLLGLFLTSAAWKQGLVSAVLVAGVLPFSTQFQTGLGIPARMYTAHLVEQAMHLWQFSAVSANDIIVLENGIAHVDLPCSGLKSLWTGSMFLLLVTGLERRRLGLRWLLAASGTIAALFWANAVRVFLLVLVGHGLHARQYAEMLHVPLGLIGFGLACGLGWLLLQWVPKREDSLAGKDHDRAPQLPLEFMSSQSAFGQAMSRQAMSRQSISHKWQVGLVAILAVLAVVSNRAAPPPPTTAIGAIQLPQQLQATALPLSPIETQFFQHSTYPIAEKWRFDWQGVSGSMLVVASHNWQAHHPPELCMAGNGFEVDGMTHRQIMEDLDARWLSLENGTLSATYWFQSPQGTTDEFMTRFLESITHRHNPWTMVSILFDRAIAPDDESVQAITAAVQAAVADSFIPNEQASEQVVSSL